MVLSRSEEERMVVEAAGVVVEGERLYLYLFGGRGRFVQTWEGEVGRGYQEEEGRGREGESLG